MKQTKLVLLILSAVLSAPVVATAQAPNDDLNSAPRISQADFRKLLDTGNVLVIDTRDEASYTNGHIPGSISIPLGDIDKHVKELKSEKRPIVTYCA